MDKFAKAGAIINQIDRDMKTYFSEKGEEEKLWDNIFIKHQIDRRAKGEQFNMEDHICAMVYAMLSSSISWERIAKNGAIDSETGRLSPIDEIFCNYDVDRLSKCSPEKLKDELKTIKCAGLSTRKQMKALIGKENNNIEKLQRFERECGSIDKYYQQFIKEDSTSPYDKYKSLIDRLSNPGSKDKMTQLGVALTCEYLRNVGHDIPKPDRHICTILGSEGLALSDKPLDFKKEKDQWEAFQIVCKLAKETGKNVAETDYILWCYCARGYYKKGVSLDKKLAELNAMMK